MHLLLSSIPFGETIDFIIGETYVRKKLESFRKKLVFKTLLNKLCKGGTFLAGGRLIRQVDGCSMSGLISVALSNIFCAEMEYDAVKTLKSKLWKRYVDEIYSKRIKNQQDKLFEKLKNFHLKIELTTQKNPSKFLDIKFMIENGIIKASVVVKESKIPNQWSSVVFKKYKRIGIPEDLHRGQKSWSNFELGKELQKISSVNFTDNFIHSSFDSYKQKCESLIPNWLFEEKHRKALCIRILLCQWNEHYALVFPKKWESLTREKHSFDIIWKTRNISLKLESLTWKK